MTDAAAINRGVYAAQFYLKQGLPRSGSIAVPAVLIVESALIPNQLLEQPTEHGGAINPNGAYGIAQWNGPRQQKLLDFCTTKNIPFAALESQLLFVLTESANDYHDVWDAIQDANMSINEVIQVFVEKYETPADIPAEVERAKINAVSISRALTEAPVPPPPAVPAPSPPAPVPTAPPEPTVDKELEAMEQIVTALRGLPPVAIKRVLSYVSERFTPPSTT